MVPADSRRIPRVPRYSGYRYASSRFMYRTVTVCGATFQMLPFARALAMSRSYNPTCAITPVVWALPRSLATTGESLLFSFPAGTKMFQFPALASIIDGCHLFKVTGCPIRKFTDQGLFAPPRDLSQLITSFIASESQGIRHAPLFTFLISFTPFSQCGMIYTFSFRTKITFCLLHHVIDLFFCCGE